MRERRRVHRHVAVLGHAALDHDVRRTVLRHAEEQVERQLAAVVEDRDAAGRIQRGDAPAGDQRDVALVELGDQRGGRLGGRRHRRRERDDERDPAGVAHAALDERVVQQQRTFARCRRALERGAADADHRVALGEGRDDPGEPGRAGDGVELVAALGQPRGGVHVVVGAEGDDEHVGLVDARIGGHAPRLRVDRGDRLAQHAHARLGDVAVREADRVRRRATEHHVELGVAEDERVAAVDQRHVDVVAELLRQRRAQLQAAETGPENDDPGAHGPTITHRLLCRS